MTKNNEVNPHTHTHTHTHTQAGTGTERAGTECVSGVDVRGYRLAASHLKVFGEIKKYFKGARTELRDLLRDGNQSEDERIFRNLYLEFVDYKLKYPWRFLCAKIKKEEIVRPPYHLAALIKNEKRIFSDGIFFVGGVKFDLRDINPEEFLVDFFAAFGALGPYALGLDVGKNYNIFYAWEDGPYETKTVQLKKGDIVIDAGAHNGDFSALAALKGGTAYAFEPSSAIYEKLLLPTSKINIDLPGKIIPVKKALSNEVGSALFDKVEEFFGGASLLSEGGEKEEVELTTIDSFAHENNLHSVDFIKADIEGAERLMLKGARGVLKDFAPKLSICTYHLPDDKEVLEGIIRETNPKYVVEHKHSKYSKMYCHVPK